MEGLNDEPNIGLERFTRLTIAQSKLQGMLFFLTVALSSIAGRSEFSDEELNAIKKDIQDVQYAAEELAEVCEALVEDWRAQRQERESGTA